MRRWAAGAAGLTLAALIGAGPSCTADHDALAKRPPAGGAGGADAGDAEADGSSGSGGVGGPPLDASKDQFVEPVGDSELTLLHGVVDADVIAFCFARVTDGGSELLPDPVPEQGLEYGTSVSLSSIAGIDLANEDVEIHVVSTDPALIATSDCASLLAAANVTPDAGEPEVRAGALALVPQATFGAGYSDLIVAAGCLGAAAHSDPIDDSVCGAGYAPESPTLRPVVVQLSRVIQAERVGFQVVHASLGSDAVDVRSVPPENSGYSTIWIAGNVVSGAVAPRPPNLTYPSHAYGVPLAESVLDLTSPASGGQEQIPWAEVVPATGKLEIADGASFALVLLGPRLGTPAGTWWHPSAIALIPTDPDT